MSDMPWIQSYPAGVRWDSDIVPVPVHSILETSVANWPDRPAIEFMGRRLNYRELGNLADRMARGLQQIGVKPGVHVGLYLPNTPHYVIAFFGVLKAGGTVVNYSPLDAAKVLEHKIEDSRTDFLVTLDMASLYPQMAAMLGKTRLKKLIVGNLAEMTGAPEAVAADLKASKQLSAVAWEDERNVRFADLLENDGAFVAHSDCQSHGGDCRPSVHRWYHGIAEGGHADPTPISVRRAASRGRRQVGFHRCSPKGRSACWPYCRRFTFTR